MKPSVDILFISAINSFLLLHTSSSVILLEEQDIKRDDMQSIII